MRDRRRVPHLFCWYGVSSVHRGNAAGARLHRTRPTLLSIGETVQIFGSHALDEGKARDPETILYNSLITQRSQIPLNQVLHLTGAAWLVSCDIKLLQQRRQVSIVGSLGSPLLANIVLHEVLDAWFEETVGLRMNGHGFLSRIADNVVMRCEREAATPDDESGMVVVPQSAARATPRAAQAVVPEALVALPARRHPG